MTDDKLVGKNITFKEGIKSCDTPVLEDFHEGNCGQCCWFGNYIFQDDGIDQHGCIKHKLRVREHTSSCPDMVKRLYSDDNDSG